MQWFPSEHSPPFSHSGLQIAKGNFTFRSVIKIVTAYISLLKIIPYFNTSYNYNELNCISVQRETFKANIYSKAQRKDFFTSV